MSLDVLCSLTALCPSRKADTLPKTGICECGREFLQVNKVRKLCIGCQIIRDVDFSPNRSRKCDVCSEQFWPVKNNYRTCNSCREGSGRPDKYEPCVRCGRNYRPAPELKGTCMSCVQSSQKTRSLYVGQLKKNRNR